MHSLDWRVHAASSACVTIVILASKQVVTLSFLCSDNEVDIIILLSMIFINDLVVTHGLEVARIIYD